MSPCACYRVVRAKKHFVARAYNVVEDNEISILVKRDFSNSVSRYCRGVRDTNPLYQVPIEVILADSIVQVGEHDVTWCKRGLANGWKRDDDHGHESASSEARLQQLHEGAPGSLLLLI